MSSSGCDGHTRRGLAVIGSALATLRRSLFVRDAGALWAAEIVGLVIGLLQAIFVARLLGPASYGLAALIVTVPTFVFTLIDPQSQEAVIKYVGEAARRDEPERGLGVVKLAYFTDALLAGAGVALTAAVAIPAARVIVHDESSTGLILVFGLLMVSAAPTATSRAVLVTFGRFRQVALAQCAVSVVRGVAVVLSASAAGVTGFVVASGLSLVLDAFVAIALANRALKTELSGRWRRTPLSAIGSERRSILRFMTYSELTSLASVFVKQADTIVLGALGSATQVGYYRLARTTGTLVGSLTGPLQTAVYPRFVREAGAGERSVGAASRQALLKVGLPVAALVLTLVPLLPVAIEILVGSAYAPATAAAQILLTGSAISLAFFWIRPAALALGRVRFLLTNSAVVVVLVLIGYLVVADSGGAAGVAAVRAIGVSVVSNLVGAVYLLCKAAHAET